jgi:DNA polymerase III subunit delta
MYGEDAFSLAEEVKRWKFGFTQKHDGDMNLEELDGSEAKIEQIKCSISAAPFLGEKRLVILKNFLGSHKAEKLKELIPLLDKVPESTVWLITESSQPDKRSALYKALTKQATNRIFNMPKGVGLETWLKHRAQKHGGIIDSRAASYLANKVGSKLWQLDNEIQKLSLYCGVRAITAEDIDQLTSGGIERSIFNLTDQLAKKDHRAALRTIRELQEQGNEAAYIFAMIARQFRLMLEMKALSESNMPAPAIASKMQVHPFVVKNTLNQCKNFTYKELKAALNKLLVLDRRLKTGQIKLQKREEDQYMLALERIFIKSK